MLHLLIVQFIEFAINYFTDDWICDVSVIDQGADNSADLPSFLAPKLPSDPRKPIFLWLVLNIDTKKDLRKWTQLIWIKIPLEVIEFFHFSESQIDLTGSGFPIFWQLLQFYDQFNEV